MLCFGINELLHYLYSVIPPTNSESQLFTFIIANNISGIFQKTITLILSGLSGICKYLLVDWVSISNTDDNGYELCEWLCYYFNNMMTMKKLYTSHTTFEIAKSCEKMWYDPLKENTQIRNIPMGRCLLYNDKYSIILHIQYSNKCDMRGYSNGSVQIRTKPIHITIYKLFPGSDKNFFIGFIDTAKQSYNNKIRNQQRIYTCNRTSCGRWTGPILKNIITLHTSLSAYILTGQMKKIVQDIELFINPSTYKNYFVREIPYNRKILAYGPPGSGKSQLIVRIAGEFNIPIYYVECNEYLTRAINVVDRGIIVVEEIDKIIKYTASGDKKVNNSQTDKNLVLWHRVLDRIMGNKVIIYMTTNNIEYLRELNYGSLIRPGRVDKIVEIGYITIDEINEIIQKYFDNTKLFITHDLGENIVLVPADITCIVMQSDDIDVITKMIVDRNLEKLG